MEQSQIPRRQTHSRAHRHPAKRNLRRRQRRQIEIQPVQHHEDQPRRPTAQQDRQPLPEVPHLDRQPGLAAQTRLIRVPATTPDRRARAAEQGLFEEL